MTPMAVRYAGLVGKYVRMERPAVEVELLDLRASGSDATTVGCEGVVASVRDSVRVGGRAVDVLMDYGMGYPVLETEEHEWTFTIFSDEEAANRGPR